MSHRNRTATATTTTYASPFEQLRRRDAPTMSTSALANGRRAESGYAAAAGASTLSTGVRVEGPNRMRTLARLLRKPTDYMDCPKFADADAEREIFEEKVQIPKPDVSWYDPLMCELSGGTQDTRRQVGVVRRLTGKQEQLIFRRYNYARFRVRQIQDQLGVTDTSPARREPTQTEAEELLRWNAHAEFLREQIAETNVGLVLAMARRTRVRTVDFVDLVSEGNMALLRAIDKFNAELGHKFSTYACQSIVKAFSRLALKQSRHRDRFPVEFDPELENSTWEDSRRFDFEKDCADHVGEIVRANLANLTETELTVIKYRFGLQGEGDDGNTLTLSQVGQLVGLGKERVRQIQVRALLKIKNELEGEITGHRFALEDLEE